MAIETARLTLLPCNTTLLQTAIHSNDALAQHLGLSVPDDWTEFGSIALQYVLDRLQRYPDEEAWWTYFPIHKTDQRLIGSGGYKGVPSPHGAVEIGYEIAPDYRGQGLATEMAQGLIDHAFRDKRVLIILAHTLGEPNPSTAVLSKCGFTHVETLHDPEEGTIWKWELRRP